MKTPYRNTALVAALICYIIGALLFLDGDVDGVGAILLILTLQFWIVIPLLIIGLIKN